MRQLETIFDFNESGNCVAVVPRKRQKKKKTIIVGRHQGKTKCMVYDEEFYLSDEDGILRKAKGLLLQMAQSFESTTPDLSFEDAYQDCYEIALIGIRKYDPSKDVKMSTFLTQVITSKMITKNRAKFAEKRNAYAYDDKEEAGYKDVIFLGSFKSIGLGDSPSKLTVNDFMPDLEQPFRQSTFSIERIEQKISLGMVLRMFQKSGRYKEAKFLSLVIENDMSFKEAAKELKMSYWGLYQNIINYISTSDFRKESLRDALTEGDRFVPHNPSKDYLQFIGV